MRTRWWWTALTTLALAGLVVATIVVLTGSPDSQDDVVRPPRPSPEAALEAAYRTPVPATATLSGPGLDETQLVEHGTLRFESPERYEVDYGTRTRYRRVDGVTYTPAGLTGGWAKAPASPQSTSTPSATALAATTLRIPDLLGRDEPTSVTRAKSVITATFPSSQDWPRAVDYELRDGRIVSIRYKVGGGSTEMRATLVYRPVAVVSPSS